MIVGSPQEGEEERGAKRRARRPSRSPPAISLFASCGCKFSKTRRLRSTLSHSKSVREHNAKLACFGTNRFCVQLNFCRDNVLSIKKLMVRN